MHLAAESTRMQAHGLQVFVISPSGLVMHGQSLGHTVGFPSLWMDTCFCVTFASYGTGIKTIPAEEKKNRLLGYQKSRSLNTRYMQKIPEKQVPVVWEH